VAHALSISALCWSINVMGAGLQIICLESIFQNWRLCRTASSSAAGGSICTTEVAEEHGERVLTQRISVYENGHEEAREAQEF
jgi:hypothetical protein